VSGRRGQRELGGGRISEEAICALSVYKLVRGAYVVHPTPVLYIPVS